jgi:hypothetical protein
MNNVSYALMAATVLVCGLAGASFAQDYDKTFLDYDGKPTITTLPNKGTDIIYIAPGAFSRLAEYDAAIVDLPEVLISAKSEYKGAAPMDLYAISAFFRQDVTDAIVYGGYYVVDRPGAGVLYMTLAITDLKLKKKKRGLLAYTPAGYFMKAGIDATRSMMEKYDIMGLTFQAEIMDSRTNEVLASLVALRGNNGQRMEFEELDADVRSFASRLLCRLDNSRGPEEQDIDCRKQAAHHAEEHHGHATK